MKTKQPSICFDCAKSGYGKVSECPWEREFKSVPGWTAEETVVDRGKKYAGKSYRIISCPLFVPDPKTQPKQATTEEIANVKRVAAKELEGLHGKEREDARRAAYKKFHICLSCANAFATAGKTMCLPCRVKHAARCRKERKEENHDT